MHTEAHNVCFSGATNVATLRSLHWTLNLYLPKVLTFYYTLPVVGPRGYLRWRSKMFLQFLEALLSNMLNSDIVPKTYNSVDINRNTYFGVLIS